MCAQVCEMARVKLHSLLQTVLCLSWEEVCFLLGRLGDTLWPAEGMTVGTADIEAVLRPLVPVVRTLLDQHADPTKLQQLLPSLPPTNGSATFAEDLLSYCSTAEWQLFYYNHVSICTNPETEMTAKTSLYEKKTTSPYELVYLC